MKTIPDGTVTILFTDIEGSTKLAQQFPESLNTALEKHHSILKETIESGNGFIFEIVGDAFCAAFENAEDAVSAAVDIQKNLAKEKCLPDGQAGDETQIKVRIGIHTGNVKWNGTRYTGYITLARTARIMSSAYGGQIIISNDTYRLLNHDRQNNVSFKDLGERRLKDIIQPIQLYQVTAAGIRTDFPPVKTLDLRPNNLPVQLTSFIGRENEMKQLKSLLKPNRLITLSGSGGTGKTSLALQIGAEMIDEFTNGVWFVDLAPLFEPLLLPQTFLKVFGLKEDQSKTMEETLCDYLKNKQILIILDNCEHLIDECSALTEKLLSEVPGLKMIATSREALKCRGEYIYNLLPLGLPDPTEIISAEKFSQYEAVKLFIERATSIDSKFSVNNDNAAAVAGICQKLDGIPLAIELAAARINSLSVHKIYERLDDRFTLLTAGKRTALPRQQTLRALINWSYDLLSEQEKILWKRLSVFIDGWTLNAAEEICSDEQINSEEILDLLYQLTEKSIIVFDADKERYRMLETIRQFGSEKFMEENETGNILIEYLKYYMEFAEDSKPKLRGPEMITCVKKIEEENANFKKSLDIALTSGNIEYGLRLATALGYFWIVNGEFSTGVHRLESLLKEDSNISNSIRAKALYIAGTLSNFQAEFSKARKFTEEALALYRESDDKQGMAQCLNILASISSEQGLYESATELYEESISLRREIGDKKGIVAALTNLGNVKFFLGEFEAARKLIEENLALYREAGDKVGIASSLGNLGNVLSHLGEIMRARELIEESLDLQRQINDKKGTANSLLNLGTLSIDQKDFDSAQKFLDECLTLFHEIEDKSGIAYSLNELGTLAFTKGELKPADEYFKKSFSLRREIGDKLGIADSLRNLGDIAAAQKDFTEARKLYEENLSIRQEIGNKKSLADAMYKLGNVLFEQKEFDRARELHKQSLTINKEFSVKTEISKNILSLADLYSVMDNYYEAAILIGAIEETILSSSNKPDQIVIDKFEKINSVLKCKLSNEEYVNYTSAGKSTTLQEVIDFALYK